MSVNSDRERFANVALNTALSEQLTERATVSASAVLDFSAEQFALVLAGEDVLLRAASAFRAVVVASDMASVINVTEPTSKKVTALLDEVGKAIAATVPALVEVVPEYHLGLRAAADLVSAMGRILPPGYTYSDYFDQIDLIVILVHALDTECRRQMLRGRSVARCAPGQQSLTVH